MPEPAPLHPVSRRHLGALTDEVGIMQHAVGRRPDPAHGYCTDDVARALLVDLLHRREIGWEGVSESAWRNLRFLDDAFDATTSRFRNFRHVDGSWADEPGSEDAQGRAIWALGETIASSPDRAMVEAAASLVGRALPATTGMTAVRAQASALLGCDAAMRASPTGSVARAHRVLADRLRVAFRPGAASTWPWPEPRLTYENALPVQALIVAGDRLGDRRMRDDGLELLDWLIAIQTAQAGHFSPVGNGWWPRDGERSRFDQQPIEATSLLLAADSAYRLTENGRYRAAMERTYAWFLGGNDLRLRVADPGEGACHDGLTHTGVNGNMGAESTLMWLIALEHVRTLRAERPTEPRPTTSRHLSASPDDDLVGAASS